MNLDSVSAVSALWLASSVAWSQPGPTLEQQKIIDFAQHAAVHALNFRQGDLHILRAARHDFTPSGWSAFMKTLEGFLDEKGAPKFSSEFAPSGEAAIVKEENGTYYLTIAGKLTQTQNQSRTVYQHAAIDIQIRGTPPKIQHLETIYRLK